MRLIIQNKIYSLLTSIDKYIKQDGSDVRWAAAISEKVYEALDIAKLEKLPDGQ